MPRWKIFVVAFGASVAAPALLATFGVVDRDLLVVVFVPSVLVGLVTGWYADRGSRTPRVWLVDRQRMP